MRHRLTLGKVVVLILASALLLWLIGYLLVKMGQALSLPSFSEPRQAAWDFLLFCGAIGGLTMVLVQIMRLLIPVRGRFHKTMLECWFNQSFPDADRSPEVKTALEEVLKKLDVPPKNCSAKEGLKEFKLHTLQLRLPSESKKQDTLPDIYDLPLEQFCAQLSAVAELALNRPANSLSMLLCLVGSEGMDELSTWVGARTPPKEFGEQDRAMALAEAHATLARLIQRHIDGFQISVGTRWRRSLRRTVVWTSLGMGLLVSLSSLASPSLGGVFSYALYGALGGLMAGFVAMVLRDLTAIVEVRRRQS